MLLDFENAMKGSISGAVLHTVAGIFRTVDEKGHILQLLIGCDWLPDLYQNHILCRLAFPIVANPEGSVQNPSIFSSLTFIYIYHKTASLSDDSVLPIPQNEHFVDHYWTEKTNVPPSKGPLSVRDKQRR